MDNDRWEQLKENVKSKFRVLEEKTEDLIVETADGAVKQGLVEYLVVETPMGRMKLTRESKPVVLDKKFHYSHRAGQAARTEYKFSDSEFSHKLKVYKWSEDDDEWQEIDAEQFAV
ncbi:MAG: hypothetical protein HYW51_03920 [Candidatus Doudnabacteria bacterium]|nr:hypothetical protein [Candidatus Doudnabacteria bacterium]